MITAQVESLTDGIEEMKPLFLDHYSELALNQNKVPLDPQYDIYLRADAAGEILYVTVREKGKLFGYFVGFIRPALHYKTCLTLQMDIFWLHADFRDGDSLDRVEGQMVCMTLFDKVKEAAKARGVQRVFYGSKSHKDASILFEAQGATEVERYYSMWLGD
jgi:hypothetical protein